jgi:hypothetical protein
MASGMGGGVRVAGGVDPLYQHQLDLYHQSQNEAAKRLGTNVKTAYDAMGNPADTSKGSSDGSGSSSSSGTGSDLPRVGGGPGGGWPYGTAPGGGGSNTPIPQIPQIDLTKAEDAVYARAKDKIGQTSQGALSGLRSALAGRGLLGSGGEYRGTAGIATAGQQQIGEAVRDQAIHGLDLTADISKANQAATLTGRGQDISADTSRRGQDIDYNLGYRGQDITQRGQDISRMNAKDQIASSKSLQEEARRQQILSGLMSALNTGGLY